jgi:spore maturation protein CgeB
MRVMAIHPGAAWSTADVYTGLCAGLRAHKIELIEGRLDTVLNWYGALVKQGVGDGVLAPDALLLENKLNRSALVSAHMTRAALIHRPDWVIVVSGHNYNAYDARALSRAGIKTALICTESPYWMDVEPRIAEFYDVVFTNERSAIAAFGHLRCHYLPHAYNPEVHTADGPQASPCDVVFIGSMFDERKALIANVDWTGITSVIRGHFLDMVDLVDNADTVAYYRAAKISLNHHRTTTMHGSGGHIAHAESLGPRAYEIAACGAFQLCDDSRAEYQDVFGADAPTYRAGNADDLERQMRYWLGKPDERARIAQAMHQAIQPHNWTARARQVLEVLHG